MTPVCPGFRFGAAACGIKQSGALDVGLLVCDRPAATGAVFTRNRVKAAPVLLSKARLSRAGGRASAIVVNSGNANACTGRRGQEDARAMSEHAGRALDLAPAQILVSSTGVIGVPLPMPLLEAGIASAAEAARPDGFDDFARAILTTDRRPKTASRRVRLGDQMVTLLGCTKGAGMIAPNMATTLTFVATDARLGPGLLQAALGRAADATFNAIAVDGDTSTNDMIAVLAGGRAGPRALSGPALRGFENALTELLEELAQALMRDGEGVHHVVTVMVRGARSAAGARKVARAIAVSPLVKTAIAGGDPNWGRILCAAGNAGVALRPDALDLSIGQVPMVRAGLAVGTAGTEERAAAAMQGDAYHIVIDLNQGDAEARFLACDLSHEYVTINADYRT